MKTAEEILDKHLKQIDWVLDKDLPTYRNILGSLEEYADQFKVKNISSNPVLSDSLGEYEKGYEKGWREATENAIEEIRKNYSPNV